MKIPVPLSSYATPGVPLLPPTGKAGDYRADLHFGAEGMDKQSSLKSCSENTGEQRKRWDHFSFILVTGTAGGNQYLLSQPNAAIPSPAGGILWDWSKGEKLIPPY